MKTITQLDTNVSLFLLEDAEYVSMSNAEILVGEPLKLIISACNADNSFLHENVTPPEDWSAKKYCFNGTEWTLNLDYTPFRKTPQEQ
jgi:hypothetical protein